MSNKISNKKIWKIGNLTTEQQSDDIAIEEPLEIQVMYGPENARILKNISITMRTPGNDAELALGFLFTEGIIKSNDDVMDVRKPDQWIVDDLNNRILVELSYSCQPDIDRLERHFYTSSSCGVCGKSSIEALKTIRMPELVPGYPVFDKNIVLTLPDVLRKSQDVFDQTGGLHASAIFDRTGKLLILKEDVGRHNALDKIAGAGLQNHALPFKDKLLLVSGRASFELVQKAVMVGVPVLAAVGAPSSLAVELAEEAGITLIGFLRNGRFNIYSHPDRVQF